MKKRNFPKVYQIPLYSQEKTLYPGLCLEKHTGDLFINPLRCQFLPYYWGYTRGPVYCLKPDQEEISGHTKVSSLQMFASS
ncbi:hypothetical protein GDO81_012318 [Engystomops pustulosus]|uniref:Uncharacterized protein n=1 Tax=Engystomops pustulosus TaxID=76066 RepID=A0AAV7BKM8_ENGPU|nr:hypothetical protein GDO81_012318 [Engystomops pustulosus]